MRARLVLRFGTACVNLILFFPPQIGEIISRFEKKGFYLKGNLASMF